MPEPTPINPTEPTPPAPGTTTPAPTPATPPGPAVGTPAGQSDPMDTDAGRRALAAERARADTAERELRAIREKDQTELERATAKAADLEQKYAASEAQRLRLEVATQHGITGEDLLFLTATTHDELTAQAQRLATRFATNPAGQPPPAFVPNPGQAAGSATPPAPPTPTVNTGRELYQQKHAKTA